MTFETEAIVLQTYDFHEADRIIVLLTKKIRGLSVFKALIIVVVSALCI